MTIGGWIIFAILALMVLGFGICGAYLIENVAGKNHQQSELYFGGKLWPV